MSDPETGAHASARAPSAATELLRSLPQVEALAASLDGVPHRIAVAAARAEVEALRARLLAGEEPGTDGERVREAARARAERLLAPSLRPLINATGVVLHTNLGRAPLSPVAAAAAAEVASAYSNLSTTSIGASAAAATHTQSPCSASSPAPRRRSPSTTTPPRSCSA